MLTGCVTREYSRVCYQGVSRYDVLLIGCVLIGCVTRQYAGGTSGRAYLQRHQTYTTIHDKGKGKVVEGEA